MSDEFPQGWTATRVAEIAITASGGTPSTARKDYWQNGDVPWINSGALKDRVISAPSTFITKLGLESSSAKLFPRKTVVIALTGATTGRVGLLDLETSTNQSVTGIFPSPAFVPEYVFFYLRWARDAVLERALGSAQPHINKRIVDELEIPLAPLAEQRRIVAKLEKLLAKVDACQQRLAKIPVLLRRFRQSILAAACSGDLTTDWRGKNPEMNVRSSVTDGDLPPSWTSCGLKDAASVISGFAFRSSDFTGAGAPAIKISNVQYGEFVEKNQEYLPVSFLKKYPTFVVLPQTLLMALTRPITNDTLKVCLYPTTAKPGLLNQRVCKLEPTTRIHRDYLHLFMQTRPFKAQVQENLSETLQPNLSPKALDSFSIELPPLAEQQEIVRRVEALFALADQLEARYVKAKAHINKLTQSILAKAFRGELVPQDPNDEPASALLERLRGHT